VRVSIASPHVRPSPNDRRVGIRIRTFEACSGFTFVTAHRIAQQPKAAFVAGLRPSQLPGRAACQLPDQSTIIRVRPSLTDSSRPRGARSIASFGRGRHVCFTPDFGRMVATPRTDASGQKETSLLGQSRGAHRLNQLLHQRRRSPDCGALSAATEVRLKLQHSFGSGLRLVNAAELPKGGG
jgi:hypothetical protein